MSGSLRAAYFSHDKSFSPTPDYGVASAWLTLRPTPVLGVKPYFDLNAQGTDLSRASRNIQPDLREGYLQWSWGDVDLKVGRQIIVWGRADKFNPTDQLSVKDLTRVSTDDEDQRMGPFSVQAMYYLGDYRVIGVWQPEWRFPKFPIAPRAGVTVVPVRPEAPLEQFALKLDQMGSTLDWSVSYFRGYSRIPDLAVLSVSGGDVVLGQMFHRIQSLGGDLATTWGDYGFRFEGAYVLTADPGGSDPLTQNPFWYSVAGVDRSFFSQLSVNVQYLFRAILNWSDPSTAPASQQSAASALQLNSNQQQAIQHGASINIVYKAWNETLFLETAGVIWFQRNDALLKPKVTYAINDHLKAILGGELYLGPPDSYLGKNKDISTVYSELRFNF